MMIQVKGVQMMRIIWQRSPADEQDLVFRVVAALVRVPKTPLELLVLGVGLGNSRRHGVPRAHVLQHLGTEARQQREMEGTRQATLAWKARGIALTSRRQMTAISVRET